MMLGLTLAPTLITLIDSDVEMSIFIDSEEEQEGNEGKECFKEIKVKLSQDFIGLFRFQDQYSALVYDFESQLYSSNYKELSSPPPERNI